MAIEPKTPATTTGAAQAAPLSMDTSQQIRHVFRCTAAPNFHITLGQVLLKAGDIEHCPECHADVYDITDTPLGFWYLAYLGKVEKL